MDLAPSISCGAATSGISGAMFLHVAKIFVLAGICVGRYTCADISTPEYLVQLHINSKVFFIGYVHFAS